MGREAGSPDVRRVNLMHGGARSSRRGLVLGATGAAAALRPVGGRAARRRAVRVIVVGGGLAGLAAASELRRAGFEVALFEARNRLGGRVLTLRTQFGSGQYAEAGGEFVHPLHRTLIGYVRQFGLALEPASASLPARDLVYRRGKRARLSVVETDAVRASLARFDDRLGQLAKPLDPADPAVAGARLDGLSAAQLLDELRLEPTARWLVEHSLRNVFAVEPDDLSLLFLAQRRKLYGSLAARGGTMRIQGGAGRLVSALARGTRTTGSRPVTRLELGATGVAVDGSEADYCVLAIPVRTWGDITFSPDLPAPLRDAREGLQYGVATKTMLQYGRRFWLRSHLSGSVLADLPFTASWEATQRQPGGSGILTAYSTGNAGFLYSGIEPGTRVLVAADELDDVFPGTRPLVVHNATAGWLNERYSRGTAVAYARGQVTKFWQALREPVGRLHFAGEHADDFAGSMEGALRSGLRAAAAIAARERR